MIEVTDASLQKAAGEGMDEFIQVFTDKYKEVIGGELTAETMPLLTGEQHSLLAYQIFRDEVMFGGFCQLIQKGFLISFLETRLIFFNNNPITNNLITSSAGSHVSSL